jgi:hypothetical protein
MIEQTSMIEEARMIEILRKVDETSMSVMFGQEDRSERCDRRGSSRWVLQPQTEWSAT